MLGNLLLDKNWTYYTIQAVEVSVACYPVQGNGYCFKLVDGGKEQPPLRLYQSRFELQCEAHARGREEFIRWYRDRLRPILDTQIAALVNRVGASPRSVQVRELGYRWGSCGHKGDLYFHAPCGDAAANHD
jgi:hypothetical protein